MACPERSRRASILKPRARGALAALACVGVLAGAARAEAGIIIKKDGVVLVGRVDPGDVKTKAGKDGKDELVSVTIRYPRPSEVAEPINGNMTLQKDEIRWHDPSEWYPTDPYFFAHWKESLDSRWEKYRQDFLIRNPDGKPPVEDPKTARPLPGLEDVARRGNGYAIRMPKGWKKPVYENEVLVLEAEKAGAEGVAPKIISFSVPSLSPPPTDQVKWVKEELQKLTVNDAFDVKDGEATSPKPVRGGSDVEWITSTVRDGKTIFALRQIRFRAKRTYFYSCYVHETEYGTWSILFRAVLRTLALDEETPPQKPDSAHVKVGQVYRWKSNVVPDQLHWEVTSQDKDTVAFRASAAQADGSKKTTESSERLLPLDPAGRLGSLTGTVVGPRIAATETITVSGVAFECTVYEGEAGGAKIRYWLSSKFPFDVKLIVADVVKQELCEIK